MKQKKLLERILVLYLIPNSRAYTLDHLANDLGCSKKTLYVNFKNKKSLIRNVFLRYCDEVSQELRQIGMSRDTSLKAYRKILEFVSGTLHTFKISRLYETLEQMQMFEELFERLRGLIIEKSLTEANWSYSHSHQVLVTELLVSRYVRTSEHIHRISNEDFLDILTILGTRTEIDYKRKKEHLKRIYNGAHHT